MILMADVIMKHEQNSPGGKKKSPKPAKTLNFNTHRQWTGGTFRETLDNHRGNRLINVFHFRKNHQVAKVNLRFVNLNKKWETYHLAESSS